MRREESSGLTTEGKVERQLLDMVAVLPSAESTRAGGFSLHRYVYRMCDKSINQHSWHSLFLQTCQPSFYSLARPGLV